MTAAPESDSQTPDPRENKPQAYADVRADRSVEGPLGSSTAFPVAGVRETGSRSAIFLQSNLWWVTLACLLLAFVLTWRSIPSRGPSVVIRFPDGHGLKSGDAVRHRGIDVGVVEGVALSDDLTQISATVNLTPEAARLAREGTRFWIVRPQLSLAGVSGLETAVGAKYIGVSPGDPNARRQSTFEGLSAAPPDEAGEDGVDLVLRSDSRHGVSAGAPVSWRGVDVGKVLSVNLSPDARFVDIHARIDAEFTRLLRGTSQFWVTSGLGVDVGLSGLKLNADSISTIIRGGVSFATPSVAADESPVRSGQMFVLHNKPDPAWLTAGSSLPLIDFELPQTVTIQGLKSGSLMGFSRKQAFTANGVVIADDAAGPWLLTAADVTQGLVRPTGSENVAADLQIGRIDTNQTFSVSLPPAVPDVAEDRVTLIARIPTGSAQLPGVSKSLLREPAAEEECCLCRSVLSDGKLSSVIQSIGRDQLTINGDVWTVTIDLSDLSPWHGAPVVSMTDGKIIGVFVAGKTGPSIVPFRM